MSAYFDEEELKRELAACLPSHMRDCLDIIIQYGALFLDMKLEQDCEGKEVGNVFPAIRSKHWESISVKEGVLTVKADEDFIGNEFNEVFKGVTLVGAEELEYAMSVGCNKAMYNRGLGCYLEAADNNNGDHNSATMSRVCYHPGMPGGQGRVEQGRVRGASARPGSFRNQNFGWTPVATEDRSRLQRITVRVSSTGKHTLTIASANGAHSFTKEFENPALVAVDGHRVRFPRFGMYPSDMKGPPGSKVFYSAFKVGLAPPRE